MSANGRGVRRLAELTALTFELAWIADRPRTYAEAMDAQRSTCPRLTVWEDALDDGLVRVIRDRRRDRPGERYAGRASVTLTARGRAALGAR
jgi:hypothetical protein